ncbi:hypothetical protein [Oceanobacillus zhaokaii]|nr:hypothetical protein [Oceanobacillus zhaokaii]
MIKKKKNYTDFQNVVANKNNVVPEEFPDGAFGSAKKEKGNPANKSK